MEWEELTRAKKREVNKTLFDNFFNKKFYTQIMKIRYTSFSEKGRRAYNQDACKAIIGQDRAMFIVCDGMGGHSMGDVAAQTVCEAVSSYWENSQETSDCKEKVIAACNAASTAMDKRADESGHAEMGTTMVMASIEDRKVTITHCGDSRCYIFRKHEAIYKTKDHVDLSFGWEIITRCVFSFRPEIMRPDIVQFELQPGDRIFLCTDGVYRYTDPEILQARLTDDKPLNDIADVIKFLCEKNSDDNYTGMLIQVD